MSKKAKTNTMLVAIVVALVVGVAASAGTYMYMQGQEGNMYARGMAYQASLDIADKPASLTCSLGTTTFNFASAVASDGAVATQTSQYSDLYINNTDEVRAAGKVHVMLQNPVTDKDGFHNNLETDSTEFGLTSGGGTYKLYHDGDYVSGGYLIGDIPAGAAWSLNVTMTLETAVAGTFQDGQSYSCHLYVYQEDADYADVVDFTVTT